MDLTNKTVVVYGMGISGKAASILASKKGARLVLINQGAPESWLNDDLKNIEDKQCFDQDDDNLFNSLLMTDYLILSPGISRSTKIVQFALDNSIEVMSEIEFAFRFLNDEFVIALTGTNGKSTTVSMIKELLEIDQRSVFLGGNIGIPFSDYIVEDKRCDYIVLELSSFQLESMKNFKADIALFLNIEMSHGERYDNFEDYLQAKTHIVDNMTESEKLITLNDQRILNAIRDSSVDIYEINDDEKSIASLLERFDLSGLKIIGHHNLVNFSFVLELARHLEISDESFQELLNSFDGLSHRLEKVASSLGEVVINDSKSTNWASTTSAINSLKKYWEDITLILGGELRGVNDLPDNDFLKLAKDSCFEIIVIGESRRGLKKAFSHLNVNEFETLPEAVKYLSEDRRKLILFSPGFPSFDQFKNYKERGEVFKKLVRDS